MLHGIVVIDAYLIAPLGEEPLAAMGIAGGRCGFAINLASVLGGIVFVVIFGGAIITSAAQTPWVAVQAQA